MRTYIITQREREIIRVYLERGERLEGFRMLVSRARKLDLKDIDQQISLLKAFIKKIKE